MNDYNHLIGKGWINIMNLTSRKYSPLIGIIVVLIATMACAGLTTSAPAQSTAIPISPTIAFSEPLVGREPRLWVTEPETLMEKNSLPLLGAYSKTNADYLSGGDDFDELMGLYREHGRIVTLDYLWGTGQCDYSDSVDVKFVLYESSQGAHASYLYNKSVDENDPAVITIQEQQVGDESYSASGTTNSCGAELYYSFIYLRRFNVAAMMYVDTFSSNDGQYPSENFFLEWGDALDRLITTEANHNPGSAETLAALKNSITSHVEENPIPSSGTDFSGDTTAESWDKDGDGIMSYTECTMYTFETLEECDALFGMGGNDDQFPAQEP